ncbi:TPA: hypothetical protein ENG04_04990 [Candidatus Poribacteria bacterium]|nr:hypothetical protein [Candidatus Poribacteria bacterium]HEX29418.1 hypothetical protein [Candidatus Poribacteria bacterium]
MEKDLNLLRNLIEVAHQQTGLMLQAVEAEETKTLLRLLKGREAILSRIAKLMREIDEIPADILNRLRVIAKLNQTLLRGIGLKRREIAEIMAKNDIAGKMASKYKGEKGETFPMFIDISVG